MAKRLKAVFSCTPALQCGPALRYQFLFCTAAVNKHATNERSDCSHVPKLSANVKTKLQIFVKMDDLENFQANYEQRFKFKTHTVFFSLIFFFNDLLCKRSLRREKKGSGWGDFVNSGSFIA